MAPNPVVPLKIGIVGTGYAASKRVEALRADPRAELLAVTGNSPGRLAEFCHASNVKAVNSPTELVNLPQLDLIFICTINQTCGAIAQAALKSGKHVVVEYPLALEAQEAAEILELATINQKLLHVEHIEIIGGLHQALKQYLPQIGQVFHARYTTIAAQHPVEPTWKYHRQQFGFPLAAALSRIHRLTDLFGTVEKVTCNNRYWDLNKSDEADYSAYFAACFCQAQLTFDSGVIAEITYGKGDVFHRSDRTLEIDGEAGKIIFVGEKGTLITREKTQDISVASRRGLFAQDTTMVLDHLWSQQPLYIQPQASLYALQVANAARESSLSRQTVYLQSLS